jgi:hypothetical protein
LRLRLLPRRCGLFRRLGLFLLLRRCIYGNQSSDKCPHENSVGLHNWTLPRVNC